MDSHKSVDDKNFFFIFEEEDNQSFSSLDHILFKGGEMWL